MRNHPLAIFKAFLRKYKTMEILQVNKLIDFEVKITHSHPNCLESAE